MIYLRDTDKSRFFTMTKLNHELSFNPFDLVPGFYSLKAHESDSVFFCFLFFFFYTRAWPLCVGKILFAAI